MGRERRCGWSLLETSPATVVQAQQLGSRRQTLYRVGQLQVTHDLFKQHLQAFITAARATLLTWPVLVQAAKVEQQYASWQPKEFADNEPQQKSALPLEQGGASSRRSLSSRRRRRSSSQRPNRASSSWGSRPSRRLVSSSRAQQSSAGGQEQGQQSNGHQQGQEGGCRLQVRLQVGLLV